MDACTLTHARTHTLMHARTNTAHTYTHVSTHAHAYKHSRTRTQTHAHTFTHHLRPATGQLQEASPVGAGVLSTLASYVEIPNLTPMPDEIANGA
jgi:hypothetical protein